MSKKDLEKFLGTKTKSPLNTDIIYGGIAQSFDHYSVTVTKVGDNVITITVRS